MVTTYVLYPIVAFDTSGLLQTTREILRHFAENSKLALDDLFLAASRHVARDGLDQTSLGFLIIDLLPESSGSVEVLRVDFRKEGDSLTYELAMNFVEIDAALAEADRLY